MTVWKLFDGDSPHVATAEFHADRERAPHLEQAAHRPRLEKAAELIRWYQRERGIAALTVADLGCGDGGLLSLLRGTGVQAWGYDFQPSNEAGWAERGVDGRPADVFGPGLEQLDLGDLVVMTEVIEHVADPWGVLDRLYRAGVGAIVASSPATETDESHCAEHAWAFDEAGYRGLFEDAGWRVLRQERVGIFQLIVAEGQE